jgi:hypothetical protein
MSEAKCFLIEKRGCPRQEEARRCRVFASVLASRHADGIENLLKDFHKRSRSSFDA